MHYFGYLLNKLLEFYLDAVVNTLSIFQPNSEQLEKQVEKRKVALEEARLKAKGLNPSVTPALAAFGGFSPASKPCKFVFCFAFSYAGVHIARFSKIFVSTTRLSYVCTLHNRSTTRGHTLHNISIGRIADNSVWYTKYV